MLGAVKALVTGNEPPEDFNKSVREAGALLLKNNAARGRLQAEAFAITGVCHTFCADSLLYSENHVKVCRLRMGRGGKSQGSMNLMVGGTIHAPPPTRFFFFVASLASLLRVLVIPRNPSLAYFEKLRRRLNSGVQAHMAGQFKDLVHASRNATAWVEIINLMLLCDEEGEAPIDVRCYSRTKCAADAIDNNGLLFVGLREDSSPRDFVSIVSKVFTLEFITSEAKLKWFAMPIDQREVATRSTKAKLEAKAQEREKSALRAMEQLKVVSSPDTTPMKTEPLKTDSVQLEDDDANKSGYGSAYDSDSSTDYSVWHANQEKKRAAKKPAAAAAPTVNKQYDLMLEFLTSKNLQAEFAAFCKEHESP